MSVSLDRQIRGMRSDEEFLSRFGDVIDDRVAETLEELLEQRNAARPRRLIPQVPRYALLALGASLLLWHGVRGWTAWLGIAAICLAAAYPRSLIQTER